MFMPTIFPLPGRKMLREMLEDAIRNQPAPTHLREWIDLVSSDSQAKKTLDRYGRLFVLQHFWRVLYSRHAGALDRCKHKVRLAFASYLFPNAARGSLHAKSESIQKDLNLLSAARGGSDWYRQPSIYDEF
jgi:hypothetical protein